MSAGITRVLIAEALDSGLKRQQILPAIPATRLVVCRLCARLETMKDRVRRREPECFRMRSSRARSSSKPHSIPAPLDPA